MRVLLAALFVFGGVLLAVVLLGERLESTPPLLTGIALVALFLILCLAAYVLFNVEFTKPQSPEEYERQLQEWEEQGLITATDFHASRAFEVAEVEDEGRHFFLELQDGSVLYLSGQYLYDVTDQEDNQEQTPSFPCTDFTIKRHQDGWVVALLCGGQPLDYELLDLDFWDIPYWSDQGPNDGDILTEQTYDQLNNTK